MLPTLQNFRDYYQGRGFWDYYQGIENGTSEVVIIKEEGFKSENDVEI